MANNKLEWEQIEEFDTMAAKMVEMYPERFGVIDSSSVIAYGVINKDKPAGNTKPYEMSGVTEPESFNSNKKYFVKLYMTDWEAKDDSGKEWTVFSALSRIDIEKPDSGKVLGFDYKDQGVIVRTIGADWHTRGNLPSLLGSGNRVTFRDDPRGAMLAGENANLNITVDQDEEVEALSDV